MEITPSEIDKEYNRIEFINEYNLTYDNIDYLLKLGITSIKKEELIIFVNEINDLNSFCFHGSFSLENLQKLNKSFKQFDSIGEVLETFKEIIEDKKVLIKKSNKELNVIFKLKKPGKGEEEVNFNLIKINCPTEKIIENLIIHINNNKLEIDKLKNQINNQIKKYVPVLENGWCNFNDGYEQLTIFKNKFGEVKFQGLIIGDFSKKIMTLEEEIRPRERLLFLICAEDTFKRIDILANGEVFLSSGGSLGINGCGWLSLSGISYYVSK